MGPGTVIGAGVTSGAVALSTTSANLAAGVPAAGNGGNGFCAWVAPAKLKQMASAAANGPPRRRRVWLPAIGLLPECVVSEIPPFHAGDRMSANARYP